MRSYGLSFGMFGDINKCNLVLRVENIRFFAASNPKVVAGGGDWPMSSVFGSWHVQTWQPSLFVSVKQRGKDHGQTSGSHCLLGPQLQLCGHPSKNVRLQAFGQYRSSHHLLPNNFSKASEYVYTYIRKWKVVKVSPPPPNNFGICAHVCVRYYIHADTCSVKEQFLKMRLFYQIS
jgi:hypothetical protein